MRELSCSLPGRSNMFVNYCQTEGSRWVSELRRGNLVKRVQLVMLDQKDRSFKSQRLGRAPLRKWLFPPMGRCERCGMVTAHPSGRSPTIFGWAGLPSASGCSPPWVGVRGVAWLLRTRPGGVLLFLVGPGSPPQVVVPPHG